MCDIYLFYFAVSPLFRFYRDFHPAAPPSRPAAVVPPSGTALALGRHEPPYARTAPSPAVKQHTHTAASYRHVITVLPCVPDSWPLPVSGESGRFEHTSVTSPCVHRDNAPVVYNVQLDGCLADRSDVNVSLRASATKGRQTVTASEAAQVVQAAHNSPH